MSARQALSDAGFSLVELLVAMGIFAVFIAVMGTAIATMTSNVRQTQGVSDATDQARRAFDQLDKQVRYSDALNTPALVGADWYVEFRTTDTTGVPLCRQWRLVSASQQLQQRSWPADTTPVSTPVWLTVSVGVVNDPTTSPPFTFAAAGPPRPYQQLTVDLQTQRSRKPVGRAQTKATFYARNTNQSTVTNDGTTTVCDQVPRT